MKIYFAGSIRGGREDKDLYLKIIELLKQYGTVLTEHVGDKDLTRAGENNLSEEYIYDRDMNWLNQSDIIVAEVTTPSLGVGYEIAKAENRKSRLCPYRQQQGKSLSAMIAGNKNMKIERYKDLSDIEKILEEFFKRLNI